MKKKKRFESLRDWWEKYRIVFYAYFSGYSWMWFFDSIGRGSVAGVIIFLTLTVFLLGRAFSLRIEQEATMNVFARIIAILIRGINKEDAKKVGLGDVKKVIDEDSK